MKKILFFVWAFAASLAFAVVPEDFDHFVDLTVAGYDGEDPLADFPVLVRISPDRIPGFSYAFCKQGGGDMAFFSDDGATEYPHEIDTWNPEGESLVWVKVPLAKKLSFKMCFGAATANTGNDPTNVWTKYAVVWHMNENGSDSKIGKPITPSSGIAAVTTDLLGRGYENTKKAAVKLATDYKFGNLSDQTKMTISGWFRQEFPKYLTGTTHQRIFSTKKDPGDKGLEIVLTGDKRALLRANGNSKTVVGSTAGLAYVTTPSTWVHVTGVYDGTAGSIYLDGVEFESGTTAGLPSTFDNALAIGNCGGNAASDGNVTYGVMDEVRVHDGAASADWIAAEYATVWDADFLSCGFLDNESLVTFDGAPVVTETESGYAATVTVTGGSGPVSFIVRNLTDGTATTNLVSASAKADDVLSLDLPGLVNGAKYRVDAWSRSDRGTESVATGTYAFICGTPTGIPGAFKWNAIEEVWENGENWLADEASERKVPGVPGDELEFSLGGRWNEQGVVYGSNAVLSIARDVCIGSIVVEGGYGHHLRFFPEEGKRVYFDNNGEISTVEMKGSLNELTFGSLETSSELQLNNPVEFTRDSTYGLNVNFNSVLVGGSEAQPKSLSFTANGDEWQKVYVHLLNVGNTFRGDIFVEKTWNASIAFLVGSEEIPGVDSMLGDARNTVTLREGAGKNAVRLKYFPAENADVNRRIFGSGIIESTKGVAFGSRAALSPSKPKSLTEPDESDYGSLRVTAVGSIGDDAATRYEIDIDPDDPAVSDTIAFTLSGTLDLRGRFVIDDANGKVAAGTRRRIGSVTNRIDGAVVRTRLKSANPRYSVTIEEDVPENRNSWLVYAIRKTDGFRLFFR